MDAICEGARAVLDLEVYFNVESSESTTNGSRKPRPTPLDRRSGIPLYHQIQRRLLDQIQSGELKPGEPLPSIQQIATRMGVKTNYETMPDVESTLDAIRSKRVDIVAAPTIVTAARDEELDFSLPIM